MIGSSLHRSNRGAPLPGARTQVSKCSRFRGGPWSRTSGPRRSPSFVIPLIKLLHLLHGDLDARLSHPTFVARTPSPGPSLRWSFSPSLRNRLSGGAAVLLSSDRSQVCNWGQNQDCPKGHRKTPSLQILQVSCHNDLLDAIRRIYYLGNEYELLRIGPLYRGRTGAGAVAGAVAQSHTDNFRYEFSNFSILVGAKEIHPETVEAGGRGSSRWLESRPGAFRTRLGGVH
jgi:hypothetical protein